MKIAKVPTEAFPADGLAHATKLIKKVCELAGEPTLIEDSRAEFMHLGLLDAIQQHRDTDIFAWMHRALSFHGVSDFVAATYMERHGSVSAADVRRGLRSGPPCASLRSYWHFNCGYRKTAAICNQPEHIAACPLPKHDLRNGNLNQAAYSLYLWMRDCAGGDFVAWLDERLEQADRPNAADRLRRLGEAVIGPLRHVHGISDKVLNMTLASLLLAGDPERQRWIAAGTGMIACDTLVHAWMHSTGILRRLNAEHPYGTRCYRPRGCAAIIEKVAKRIDARKFNPDFPARFPRFVQKAIWRYCAQTELDICNGNRIDHSRPCENSECRLYTSCDRIALKPPRL
jgi:hypothetical protein